MLGRLAIRRDPGRDDRVLRVRDGVLVHAQLATTWYQAHIVAVGLTMLAVGLAIGADPAADEPDADGPARGALQPSAAPRPPPVRHRPASVRCRPPVRPRLHGPHPVLVAAPFLAARRAGRRAPGGAAGRRALGAAIPVGAARSPTTWSRPARSSTRPTTTCTSSRRRLPDARLPPGLGHRGSALPAPEPRHHVALDRRTILPDRLPDALGTTTRRLHRARRRRAACSTRRARWPSRATSG